MRRALAGMVLAVLFAAPAGAQAVGAILSGIVTDESGARLPGVAITLTNVSNGRAQTLVTGALGEYRAVALQPAPYRIAADLNGFLHSGREVILTVGSEATLDFRLTMAGVRESVTVAARDISFQLAKPQPSSLVVGGEIEALPQLGRNFLELAQLLPGSAPLNASVTRFASTKFGGVADQRSGFTTIIDGGEVDDAQWGSPTINVTQESVQEFKVFRYQFDAQYGAALGAVVLVVTKAGGNQFGASALYFGRDRRLNARNAFAQENRRSTNIGSAGRLAARWCTVGPTCSARTNPTTSIRRASSRSPPAVSLPAKTGCFPRAPTTGWPTSRSTTGSPTRTAASCDMRTRTRRSRGWQSPPRRIRARSTPSAARTASWPRRTGSFRRGR